MHRLCQAALRATDLSVKVTEVGSKKTALYGLVAIWILTVVLWPTPSNVASIREFGDPRQATGEGLYKASLTGANFGLLGVQVFETNDGKKHWNIRSRFAELHRKENYAFMKEVDADFFAEKTGNVVTTKSDYGRSLIEKNLVELEGNVAIRSKRGYLFTMDKLNYDGNTHGFSTEESVQMKGPDISKPSMFLRGTGLNADIDREHFILKRNVNAQKKLKSSEWLRVQSRSGEFFTDENRAVFIGKVRSVLPNTHIDSDIFEMSMNQERELLTARGNVKLTSRDRIGRADNVELEIGGNKIVLEGKARIESKDNQIAGKRIVMYTDEDRVEVQEAEGKLRQ